MKLTFDISTDELPVFIAETGEQFQILEQGLVRLEHGDGEEGLIQALFRAAHTLKGTAGMIGHTRMVDLTHALETALDGVRKQQVEVTPPLIDDCLSAVDSLRMLCGEVLNGVESPVDAGPLVGRLLSRNPAATLVERSSPVAAPPAPASTPAGKEIGNLPAVGNSAVGEGPIKITAQISPDSIASAARAFQLMLALREVGEIVFMDPSQEQIETSAPVQVFTAEINPTQTLDEVRKTLSAIDDIDHLEIGGARVQPEPASAPVQVEYQPKEGGSGRIGDILVRNGLITEAQLNEALEYHKQQQGPAAILGQTLVKMGLITQDVLDQVIAEQARGKQHARLAENLADDHQKSHLADKTIRTSVERLDNLMNLVGELITDRNRLTLIRGELESRFRGDGQVESLSETITHVGRITDQLQAEVMSIRMLPVGSVFNKFPRVVRDLARKAYKQIDLVIRGEDTELDRSVIEVISDPLLHMLRNAVDHGLETPAERIAAGKPERAAILMTARHEQGRIILTVEDDGRGIDLARVKAKAVERGVLGEKEAESMTDEEAIDLIFISGLSTARLVSDVSGRGVGMDIVRNNIERLNGSISVETWLGKGSRFQIVLPLTLAIVPTLLVQVAKGIFAIPLVTVSETLRVTNDEIHTINRRPVIRLRDHVLPVISLAEIFGFTASKNGTQYKYIVVVRSGKNQVGLIVDTLVGEQEVVVKSLSTVIGEISGISSAAILGDGQVALILDIQGLLKLAAVH